MGSCLKTVKGPRLDSSAPYKLDVVASCAFVILGRYRQEGHEFKTILSLHGSLRPAWETREEKLEEALGDPYQS